MSGTVSTKLIFVLRKLGFFNRASATILGLLFFGMDALHTYIRFNHHPLPQSIMPITDLVLNIVVAIEILVIPLAIYKIGREASFILEQPRLCPPAYKPLIIGPILVKLTLFIVSTIKNPAPSTAIPRGLISLTTIAILTLPMIVAGITTSTFASFCQRLQADQSIITREKSKQLLDQFRSVKSGCQHILFVIFVSNTLVGIGVGYLIVIVIGCMKMNVFGGISYTLYLANTISYLIYFGFIMEDCFDKFQNAADYLRYKLMCLITACPLIFARSL